MRVLGLSPERAKALLEQQGLAVSMEEARCKKGVEDGTQARVIRQTQTDDTHATLVYAVFRTEPSEANA